MSSSPQILYCMSQNYMRRANRDGWPVYARAALDRDFRIIFYNETLRTDPIFAPRAESFFPDSAPEDAYPLGQEPVLLVEDDGYLTPKGLELRRIAGMPVPHVFSDPNFKEVPPLPASLRPESLRRKLPPDFFARPK